MPQLPLLLHACTRGAHVLKLKPTLRLPRLTGSRLQAAATLASLALLEVSGAARVRALHQPSVSLNDSLWYPLIVLPELLQQVLACWPTLLHRTGLADGYTGWRTATWGWVQHRFPPSTDAAAAAEAGAGKAASSGSRGASCAASTAGSTGSGKADKEGSKRHDVEVACIAA